jgi:hypothetical protein
MTLARQPEPTEPPVPEVPKPFPLPEPQPDDEGTYSPLFAQIVVLGFTLLIAALWGIGVVWGPR